jgi:hypothetical protein
MEMFLSLHAMERIYDRNINIEFLKKTVKNPDFIENIGNRIKVKKKSDNKSLVVIYIIRNHRYVIITAYYEN